MTATARRFRRLPAMLAVALAAACSGGDPPADRGPAPWTAQDIERNNRGVALMGYFDYPRARDVFAELVQDKPQHVDARINLAIATLNRQEANDEVLAMTELDAVLAVVPDNVRARYIKGLLLLNAGQPELAGDYFAAVAEDRPRDAYAAYFRAQTLAKTERLDEALAAYRRAIDNDPYLRSAYYGAAQTLRQLRRADEAREMLDAYQRFENNPRARLAEFKYTRMGPLANAWTVGDAPAPSPRPDGPLFADPVAIDVAAPGGPAGSVTTADINGDGLQDLFIAAGPGASGDNSVLMAQDDGGFVAAAGHPLAKVRDVRAAFWGDVDNDGHIDVYLGRLGPNALWLQQPDGEWRDATAASGTAGGKADSVDGALIDADHDGDLDIYVANADGPNELFNNNLDGSFRPLAGDYDIQGDGAGSRGVAVADLDGDRDADLVVVGRGANVVYLNDRLWTYRRADGFDDFLTAPLLAAVAGDVDTDGQTEIYTIDDQGSVDRWAPGPEVGAGWRRTALGISLATGGTTPKLALLDIDGDARLDLLTLETGVITVWNLAGADQPKAAYRYQGPVMSAIPVLRDPAAGPALVGLVQHGERPRLSEWAAGPGRHGFTAVAVSGKLDSAESMRSNRSGIGTRLSLRIGDTWSVATTFDSDSAPGASHQPVALGLAGRDRADYIAIDWSDGVFQTELDLRKGVVHAIPETQRQLSSCPVVFAWDGEKFGFVSDVLGVGGLGFLIEPGRYAQPRPWEFFLMPPASLAPRDGRYQIKITEPMEEVAYLDSLRLHVYDLPEGWSMVLDERMATGAPAVTGRPIWYRRAAPLHRAYNERGRDVSERLARADRLAAPPGRLDPRFIGRLAASHALTLEFAEPIDATAQPVLVAHGWVEYPYSQTVFAAWQAGATYDPPTLEARVSGRWMTLYPRFGYPAGMPRSMSLPLADLPAGVDALRLTTNLQIYWDAIEVVYEEQPPFVHHTVLEPVLAEQAQTGFPRRRDGPQRAPDFDYGQRLGVWDTRYLAGWYSPLGDVLELVADTDDAVAVIGPGEEAHVEFEAAGDPAAGQRRFVLEVRGWAKDMDMYTRDGGTIEPMPSRGSESAAGELYERYLIRYQAGR